MPSLVALSPRLPRLTFVGSRTGRLWIAGLVAGVILFGVLLPAYMQSARFRYPIGDGAMLEVYTLHATRGAWPFGPYSQFGWQHPGSMYFYLLAPFYLMAQGRTMAMHVGTLAINLAAVATIVIVLLRRATPMVALAVLAVLAVYLYRGADLLVSYWNPHVVVLPVAAMLMLSSRLAEGRVGTLPAVAVAGSFLAQTHVSLVPYAGLVGGIAFVTALIVGRIRPDGSQLPTPRRSLAWWMNLTAWLLLLLWLLPLAEQLTHAPGNVTKMMRFFAQAYNRSSWDLVGRVWGDVMTAAFRPGFHLPLGWRMKPASDSLLLALSIGQVLLLAVCCRVAAARRDRFGAALSGLGALAAVIAFWSITKIRGPVGDHMVFWMSIVGALNWAIVVGVLSAPYVVSARVHDLLRRAALALGAIVTVGCVIAGIAGLEDIRRTRALTETERSIKAVADDIDAYLAMRQRTRPLFRIAGGSWGEAAGIVLDRYRRGVPVAVDAERVPLYGEPLAATRQEDLLLVIVDAPVHDILGKRSGNVLVSHHGPVYIYTGTELNW